VIYKTVLSVESKTESNTDVKEDKKHLFHFKDTGPNLIPSTLHRTGKEMGRTFSAHGPNTRKLLAEKIEVERTRNRMTKVLKYTLNNT
jgi:hypothetical protein